MKTYIIERGGKEIELQADGMRKEPISGETILFVGEGEEREDVGRFLNVTACYVKPAA